MLCVTYTIEVLRKWVLLSLLSLFTFFIFILYHIRKESFPKIGNLCSSLFGVTKAREMGVWGRKSEGNGGRKCVNVKIWAGIFLGNVLVSEIREIFVHTPEIRVRMLKFFELVGCGEPGRFGWLGERRVSGMSAPGPYGWVWGWVCSFSWAVGGVGGRRRRQGVGLGLD